MFGSDLNSKNLGIVTGGIIGTSTYDFYDNTSTGLLNDTQNFSRSQQYQRHQKSRVNKVLGFDDSPEEENYNRHYEEDEDDEHYMNGVGNYGSTIPKRGVNMFGEERAENESLNENGDDTSSSGHKSSQDGDQQTFVPNAKKNLYSNTNLNYSRDYKPTNTKLMNSSSTNFNSNNYSTIDSKNLKVSLIAITYNVS